MLTVIVGLDGSGNISTLSPLGSWYSVIPSTSCTFTGVTLAEPGTRWPGLRPLASIGVTLPVFGGADCGCAAARGTARATRSATRNLVMGSSAEGRCCRGRRNYLRGAAAPCDDALQAAPPRLVEANTARHRHVQALNRAQHGNRHQQVA